MLETFDYIILEDIKEASFNNLKEFPEYYFEATMEDDPHRFNLHFSNSNLGIDPEIINPITVWSYQGDLYIYNPMIEKATAEIFDILGKRVQLSNEIHTGLNLIKMNEQPGYYLVKISSGEISNSSKVLIR